MTTKCGTAIVDRTLAFECDPSCSPDAVYAEHSPFFAAQIVKKNLGEHISCVFEGDTFMARCFDHVEHQVTGDDQDHLDETEVNVRLPYGTQSNHISNVVMDHNKVAFTLPGWGTWSRFVQGYTYLKEERDRYVDWSGATWTLAPESEDHCVLQFSLPRHHTRLGDKKEQKKFRRNPRPFFIEDDDPFKLYGMVEARMYSCIEDHYKGRELLSKAAEEHIKDFETAKLNLYMIKNTPEDAAPAEEDSESLDSDDETSVVERAVQLWQEPPTKPLADWVEQERRKRNEEWAQLHAPKATAEALKLAKQAKQDKLDAERKLEQEKWEAENKKNPKELTRLQQRILEKKKKEAYDAANAPPLLFKRKVEVQQEQWQTIDGYSWEDAGDTIHVFLSLSAVKTAASVELKAEYDSFWVGIKSDQGNFCLLVENLKHDIDEDASTVKWRSSSKRAIITLKKLDPTTTWGFLQKGSSL